MDIFSPVKLIVRGNWTLSSQAARPPRQPRQVGVLSRAHLMGETGESGSVYRQILRT